MSLLSPQLEAFLAITKNKTVHAAAAELHLTQTAVTQRIRTLEKQLATTLFIRTRRGMMLTTEGEALLRYCLATKDLEGETLAKIRGSAEETTVRVCITGPTSIMRSRIIPQCFPVMDQFPNLLMHFDIADIPTGVGALRAGKSQFAIIQENEIAPEMEYKILRPEYYVLVCTSKWQQRDLSEIIQQERIIDFNPEDQITFNYLKQYDLLELAEPERHFVNRTESLAMMLIAGYGYGALSKEFSKPYIDSKELMILNQGQVYENRPVLAWFTRPEPPRYFAAVIEGIS